MRRALAATLVVAAAGCVAHRPGGGSSPEGGAWVGTYRAELEEGGARTRHARLALWAELPDRLHAELSGPVGGVRLTLDAGGGQACVVDASSGIAYVGGEGSDALFALTGVRVAVVDAVAALLTGRAPEGLAVERDGAEGSLPLRLKIGRAGSSVTLERIRIERARPAQPLGTGRAPDRLPVRPLSELSATGPSGDGS